MKKIKITVLGSGNAFNHGNRNHPGFLIETSENKFLLDCGASTLLELRKIGLKVSELQSIIISHFHGDHTAGIPFLLLDFHHLSKRNSDFYCIGPLGTQKIIETLYSAFYPKTALERRTYALKYLEVKPNQKMNNFGIILEPFSMLHTEEALGYRITTPEGVIAYTGDTSWNNNIIEMALDADILICECNFWNLDLGGHMSYKVLEKNEEKIKAKKIYLTHPSEDILDHQNELKIPLVSDGQVIEL